MNPYHVSFYFKVSKASGLVADVLYVPALEAVETADHFYIVAETHNLQDYENLRQAGPVAINDLIPGTFTKKRR
ncbi:hypothetical protein [Pseudomonas sp. D(2018)]|uniref:hypothetical protein n=1 Tax=Pseudomonas sp. D(2018) TaxID=2502238 RepID=UPI0010F95856|nr:hypothetical protein [Pseudomonas sp. D(2018)]